MICRLVLFIIAFQVAYFIGAALGARGPKELQRDVPDGFKAIAAFEHPIAIADTDNDSILECLSAHRQDFNSEAKTVTYVWSLVGENGKERQLIPVHITEGDTPDTIRFTVGPECTLWVQDFVKDLIPDECVIQYNDICGDGYPIYAQDMCKDAYK
ncbi:uncharacterized protein LOC144152121 isoform X2 [Haemaphysalis longicornis]